MERRWVSTFSARYEAWGEAERPDLYETLFLGPCCEQAPEGLILTRPTLADHSEVIQEWAQQAAG